LRLVSAAEYGMSQALTWNIGIASSMASRDDGPVSSDERWDG
jgi:hypothetical protein